MIWSKTGEQVQGRAKKMIEEPVCLPYKERLEELQEETTQGYQYVQIPKGRKKTSARPFPVVLTGRTRANEMEILAQMEIHEFRFKNRDETSW